MTQNVSSALRKQRLEQFAAAHHLKSVEDIPKHLEADAERFVETGVATWSRTTTPNGTAGGSANIAEHHPKVRSTPAHSGVLVAPSTDPIDLSPTERSGIAKKKATCPFMGSAVNTGQLKVRNDEDNPLASVDDIVALGDSGGGDLGSKVLTVFARGNHSKMLGPSGELDIPTPAGMMSLDLAGSQGAHPGHSGIMLGDPSKVGGGRFSEADFDRLAAKAKNGYLDEKAVGEYIAENLMRDPDSKVLPVGRLALDLFGVVDEVGDTIWAKLTGRHSERDEVELLEKLTKLAGEDNLVGSAGEFGLLFAFFENRPGKDKKDDPGIPLADVKEMMMNHRFPEGWETWPKNATDWVHSTTKLTAHAAKEYVKLKLKD